MKGLPLVLIVLFYFNNAYSQIPTLSFFNGDASIPTRTVFDAPVVRMPKVDLEKLKREDLEEAKMGIPPRFGKDIDVDFTLENSGRWEKVKGGNVWKLEVYSENSHSINMIFNDFFLAEGSELIIYNKEMNMMAGPITSFSNNKSRKFSTDIIIGQSVILEF